MLTRRELLQNGRADRRGDAHRLRRRPRRRQAEDRPHPRRPDGAAVGELQLQRAGAARHLQDHAGARSDRDRHHVGAHREPSRCARHPAAWCGTPRPVDASSRRGPRRPWRGSRWRGAIDGTGCRRARGTDSARRCARGCDRARRGARPPGVPGHGSSRARGAAQVASRGRPGAGSARSRRSSTRPVGFSSPTT